MDASQNVLIIFMEATYKSNAVGTVKRGSGRVPSKYMKSPFRHCVKPCGAMLPRISPLSDFSSVPRGINYARGY